MNAVALRGVLVACLLAVAYGSEAGSEPLTASNLATGDLGVSFGAPTKIIVQDLDEKEILVIHLDTKRVEWNGDQREAAVKFWKVVEQTWPDVCGAKP